MMRLCIMLLTNFQVEKKPKCEFRLIRLFIKNTNLG